jgi:hypothetical protein
MFASGWQTILVLLRELDQPSSDAVTTEIAVNEVYREKYLSMLDYVEAVVDATYANVQVLLTTTREMFSGRSRVCDLILLRRQRTTRNTSRLVSVTVPPSRP